MMINNERTPLPVGYPIHDPDGGKCTITGVLGEGGSGIIYTAQSRHTDILIKEVFPLGKGRYYRGDDGSIVPRLPEKDMRKLEDEYNMGEDISNKVAWVSPIWKPFRAANGSIYAFMNRQQPGISLRTLLMCSEAADIGLRDWVRLILKLTEIIRDIHNKAHILHLDISPSNVLILGDDEPKAAVERIMANQDIGISVQIIDFGSAVKIDKSGCASLTSRSPTTEGFSAPELYWKGKRDVDKRTDIFSICACLDACVKCMPEEKYHKLKPTVREQVEKIISIGTDDILCRWQNADVLMIQLEEAIRRIDGQGVSKAALWEAARKDYISKRSGRFSGLSIVEEILPRGDEENPGRTFDVKAGDGNKQSIILDLIAEYRESNNICIYGEGGIGKTTTLIRLMQDEYKKDIYDPASPTVIFIELNRCPANLFKIEKKSGGHSRFIARYLRMLLEGTDFGDKNTDTLEQIYKEFRKVESERTTKGKEPEYLLLLDGMNEVPAQGKKKKKKKKDNTINDSPRSLLLKELQYILREFPNVRAIVTSRTEHRELNSLQENLFVNIQLEGITEDTVKEYLKEMPEHLEVASNNPKLMEILKIPLFLTIFDRVSPDRMYTRGSLLRAFWHEKERIEKERLEKEQAEYTQAGIHKRHATDDNFRALRPNAYSFILKIILPEICFEMEREHTFSLTDKETEQIIQRILDDRGEYGILGEYGADCFDEFSVNENGAWRYISDIADDITAALGKKTAKTIAGELAGSIAALYIGERSYGVKHQHIRDYFAGVGIANRMRLAEHIFRECSAVPARELLSFMREHPIDREIRLFIGEYLDEDKNAPVLKNGAWQYNVPSYTCPRNLLKRVLDIYRGVFDSSEGYAVYSIVEIFKEVRRDLSGADLHELDLSYISLNGIDLGERGGGVNLHGVKITRESLFPVGHTDVINFVAYSPDSMRIVTASRDNTAKVWDAETGNIILSVKGHENSVILATYSPDGNHIVTASLDNTIKMWNSETGELITTFIGHSNRVTCANFSPDGSSIITASRDGTIKIWNAKTGSLVNNLNGITDIANYVEFSPDGKHLIILLEPYAHVAWVYDIETGSILLPFVCNKKVNSAKYSPDGKRIITASSDNTVNIWDAESGSHLITLDGHTRTVYSASYSKNGKYIVTASGDKTAKIWDAESGTHLRTLTGHANEVKHAIFSPDGQKIITLYGEESIKVWDTSTGLLLMTLDGYKDQIENAVYSPNGSKIVTASWDKTAKVWNVDTGMLQMTLEGHMDYVSSAAYSPDNSKIVTSSYDKTAKVWDAETGVLIKCIVGHTDAIHFAMYSPDGSNIITESVKTDIEEVYTTYIWDTKTYVLIKTFVGHTSLFSPEAKESINFSNMLWQVDSLPVFIEEDAGWIISYCSKIQCIITASYTDFNVRVWDAETGLLKNILVGHSDIVKNAVFSPEGNSIVTASYDGTIKIWNIVTGKCIDTIPNIPGLRVVGVDMRNLHPDSQFSDADKELLLRYGAVI